VRWTWSLPCSRLALAARGPLPRTPKPVDLTLEFDELGVAIDSCGDRTEHRDDDRGASQEECENARCRKQHALSLVGRLVRQLEILYAVPGPISTRYTSSNA